ncbi:uncharacterized protein [Dendropsophus ebraccatus]|uniref:uncharacterized protein n=1 Tax=Dendropsophus ebraccatus TaxID=150705 RepID=UPI0038321E03
MLSRLFWRWFGLSADEKRQVYDTKERTLRLLSDALKKKESLLVKDLKEFEDQNFKDNYCPLISTDLVKDLIRELEKVTFAKNINPEQDIKSIAYIYSGCEDRTIYLCAPYWKARPDSTTQQNTIIHEVSHLLGYGHTVQENSEAVQRSPQSMLCPLTAYTVASALTDDMDHPGTYRGGSYSCCGETSRDTVCEKSKMADNPRSLRGTKEDDYKIPAIYLLFQKNPNLISVLWMMKTFFLGINFTLSELDKEAK